MAETNQEKAVELLEQMTEEEDRVAAVFGYAILALADELRNLAVEVEKAGWAAKER